MSRRAFSAVCGPCARCALTVGAVRDPPVLARSFPNLPQSRAIEERDLSWLLRVLLPFVSPEPIPHDVVRWAADGNDVGNAVAVEIAAALLLGSRLAITFAVWAEYSNTRS